jgi:hypothetical protein
MNANKRKKLEAAGWAVGTTSDFLALSDEEATVVEMRVVLASALRARRLDQKFSQAEFAKRIRSSQSRVGKMEKADSSVSLELLVKSLVSLGATRSEIGKLISATDAKEPKAKKDGALSKV